MHIPPGENEYISVNVSLFVIYIMYKHSCHPPAVHLFTLHFSDRVKRGGVKQLCYLFHHIYYISFHSPIHFIHWLYNSLLIVCSLTQLSEPILYQTVPRVSLGFDKDRSWHSYTVLQCGSALFLTKTTNILMPQPV